MVCREIGRVKLRLNREIVIMVQCACLVICMIPWLAMIFHKADCTLLFQHRSVLLLVASGRVVAERIYKI